MSSKSNNDPPFKFEYDRDYNLDLTFQIPNSYCNTNQYSSPIDAKRDFKNEEREEMRIKMKSLEKNIRDMQGLGGHKSLSFTDLCMFRKFIYLLVSKLKNLRRIMDMEIHLIIFKEIL